MTDVRIKLNIGERTINIEWWVLLIIRRRAK